jgi:hypothetical protein
MVFAIWKMRSRKVAGAGQVDGTIIIPKVLQCICNSAPLNFLHFHKDSQIAASTEFHSINHILKIHLSGRLCHYQQHGTVHAIVGPFMGPPHAKRSLDLISSFILSAIRPLCHVNNDVRYVMICDVLVTHSIIHMSITSIVQYVVKLQMECVTLEMHQESRVTFNILLKRVLIHTWNLW